MANLSGTLNVFRALIQPRLIVPAVTVKSIRGLNFQALKEAGYAGAVFDKDNCLTIPDEDQLVPELKEAWRECKDVFGEGNVLIVSNSAGTRSDPLGVQAESVSHHLGVPVLLHSTKKPGCTAAIHRYFASLPQPINLTSDPQALSSSLLHPSHASESRSKIIVVGDRLFTDVLLANRLGSAHALAVWTTGLWTKEAMVLRTLENAFLRLVMRFRIWRKSSEASLPLGMERRVQGFVKDERRLPSRRTSPLTPPRAWYSRLIMQMLGLTWGSLRWVGRRIAEGHAARVARRKEQQETGAMLNARDLEMSEHVGLWEKLRRMFHVQRAKDQTGKDGGNILKEASQSRDTVQGQTSVS